MSKKFKFQPDRNFQELAAKINNAIIRNDGLIGDQKAQVELVMELERKFKYHILKYQQAHNIYRKFSESMNDSDGNILSAQPFFRENEVVFRNKIKKAIKENNTEELIKFDINAKMIEYIVSNWRGKLPERAARYYKEFKEARNILIENNLPLAINRAKLFYRKTPKSPNFDLIDFIDICTCGLIVGIDKYSGEYSKVWRSVCIGRMVGFMIDEYSKTFLKMYPSDRKILYRANSLKHRLKIEDIPELTKAVNESFEKDKKEGKAIPKLPISELHITTLLNASSYTSADTKTTSDGDSTGEGANIYDYASNEVDLEEEIIKDDAIQKVRQVSNVLTNLERKIIRLKGVEL